MSTPCARAYAVTTSPDMIIGLALGSPGAEMPYSVSIPITRRTVMGSPYGRCDRFRGEGAAAR